MPIFAVPISRTRWDQPFDRAGLLLIGPIESDRRRILMEPGGRDGIDLRALSAIAPNTRLRLAANRVSRICPAAGNHGARRV